MTQHRWPRRCGPPALISHTWRVTAADPTGLWEHHRPTQGPARSAQCSARGVEAGSASRPTGRRPEACAARPPHTSPRAGHANPPRHCRIQVPLKHPLTSDSGPRRLIDHKLHGHASAVAPIEGGRIKAESLRACFEHLQLTRVEHPALHRHHPWAGPARMTHYGAIPRIAPPREAAR